MHRPTPLPVPLSTCPHPCPCLVFPAPSIHGCACPFLAMPHPMPSCLRPSLVHGCTPTHVSSLIYAFSCPCPWLHALFHACTHPHMPSPCLHPHASLASTWPLSIHTCACPCIPAPSTIHARTLIHSCTPVLCVHTPAVCMHLCIGVQEDSSYRVYRGLHLWICFLRSWCSGLSDFPFLQKVLCPVTPHQNSCLTTGYFDDPNHPRLNTDQLLSIADRCTWASIPTSNPDHFPPYSH